MAGISTNPYAAGTRRYMGSGRAPNVGAVRNKTGYNRRDLQREAQQRALAETLRRTQRRRTI